MNLCKNFYAAIAMLSASLGSSVKCSHNEAEIFTEKPQAATSPSASGKKIFSSYVIPVGNSPCPNAGMGFNNCIDTNGDGVCSASVDDKFSSKSICYSSTEDIYSSVEPPGSNCSAGGIKLQQFIDDNQNGAYDAGEATISISSYVCNSPISMSTINGAADGLIDVADTTADLVVVENPFVVFDSVRYVIVSASTTSCSAVSDSVFNAATATAPRANDGGFASGSFYKICARVQIGSDTKLLLSSAFKKL